MGNPQKVDPTLVASGATGALADNPHDKNMVSAPTNPADYEEAVSPGATPSPAAAPPAPLAVPAPAVPAVLTPAENVSGQMNRPPMDVFGDPVLDTIPGRTNEPSASQTAPVATAPLLDRWNAALVENNEFSRWASNMAADPEYTAVPGYDPWKDIESTPYADYASEFVRSDSPAETQAIKNNIDARNAHNAILDTPGGRAMAMASGLFSPLMLASAMIPIAPEVMFASRTARIGLGVAANAGLQTASEVYMHPEEPLSSLALNVGAGALLTGVLGHFIAPRVPLTQFERARVELEAQMRGIVPPESSTAGAMHAGATLNDLTLARGGNFIANTAGEISPITRVGQSSTLEGRKLGLELVDGPGLLNQNFEGVATGHSAEAVIKTELNKRNLASITTLDDAYKQYRLRMGAQPALSLKQFGAETLTAMRNGGVHETIPEAAALARTTAARVFNADRAAFIEHGLIEPSETGVVGAKGYVPRVYDQPAIAARATAFQQMAERWFTDHPLGEQELADAQKARKAAEQAHVEATAEHANGMVDFYHGSHTQVEEFNAAHMGTGEGNQSFGIGHYVGEAPGTGLHYVPESGGYLMHGQTSQTVVNDMLDMEKPLTKQPGILQKLGIDPNAEVKLNGINPEWSGRELHDALAAGKTNLGVVGKQAAADFLKSKGVTGIKYLDQVSRKAGKGSRNFVFFNSADAKILGHEKVPRAGERIGSGLSEKLAAHAEEAAAARLASKEKVVAARKALTAARVAERKAKALTEFARTQPEIQQRVMQYMDQVQGTQRGTADIGRARNPNILKARTVDIPDELLQPYLVNDFEQVMHGYHRSAVPVLEMQRRFGSLDLKNELEEVSAAYHVKQAAAPTDKAREAIRREHANTLQDLTGLRDRVLGVSNDSAGGSQRFVRALAIARAYNYLRLLGKQTLSSLSDYGRLIAHYGLLRTGAATVKFLTDVAANGVVRADAKSMGHAVEWALDTRAQTLGEIGDSVAGTRAEKVAKAATHAYTRLTLMATWNSTLKDIASMLEQNAIHRAIFSDSMSAIDRAKLASHGFGDTELAAIKKQWEKYGSSEHGLNRARTQAWDDQNLAKLVETGIGKVADQVAALNVGKGDLPFLMNNSVYRTLLQFKSYGMASVNRIMIPLAQGAAHGDLAAANGMAMMMGLGGLAYWAKAKVAGQEPDMSPQRVTMESLNWSGALAWMPDAYDPIANMAHLPRFSKFADRSISESLAGPTAGTIDTLMRTASNAIPRNPWSPGKAPRNPGLTAQQVHQWRMLVPLQNHFALARLFNAVEGEAADSLGAQGATSQSFGERVMETKPATPAQ